MKGLAIFAPASDPNILFSSTIFNRHSFLVNKLCSYFNPLSAWCIVLSSCPQGASVHASTLSQVPLVIVIDSARVSPHLTLPSHTTVLQNVCLLDLLDMQILIWDTRVAPRVEIVRGLLSLTYFDI